MKFWRSLFAFAAISNLVIGGAMLAGADRVAAQMGVGGPAAQYIVGLAGLLIALFGVAYAAVAWNPAPNRNLVVIGALGKAAAAMLASYHALLGHIPNNVFLLGMGDVIFAGLFAIYLSQTRPISAAAPDRGSA